MISVAGCADGSNTPATQNPVGLIGDWQSVDDENYVLKFNPENYREVYDMEEVSRDQWQPVNNCDDKQAVEKTSATYGGFLIWTKPTDDKICYAISNWTANEVSLTYAGTTSTYKRLN
jgi:hypothetical protein